MSALLIHLSKEEVIKIVSAHLNEPEFIVMNDDGSFTFGSSDNKEKLKEINERLIAEKDIDKKVLIREEKATFRKSCEVFDPFAYLSLEYGRKPRILSQKEATALIRFIRCEFDDDLLKKKGWVRWTIKEAFVKRIIDGMLLSNTEELFVLMKRRLRELAGKGHKMGGMIHWLKKLEKEA